MHLHIVGICGTFMGGIAALARAAGHRVTGSDRTVYPPMSTQLAALGIDVIEGYTPDQLALDPDVFVIGNVMSRGNPLIEAVLDSGKRYESGPEWLARNVLTGRWVLGVAGTHGKTTTSSLLTSILAHAGLEPGFLVGGVPLDFGVSARLGAGRHFVVEADEYDTAFFDKRAKFVHYRPRTAILNNLEHDHADIYPDVASIQRQFHLLLRTIPAAGRIVMNGADRNLEQVLDMGCWTPVERFSSSASVAADWPARAAQRGERPRGTGRGAPCGRRRARGPRGPQSIPGCAPPPRGARHRGRRRRL
jgi:UDP-N-acetylmuramate: L-alanyl-gamma-D-glutamyl-meso-diaminopimelate ligase